MTAIEVPSVERAGASFAQDEIDEIYRQSVWGFEGPFAFSYAPAILGRLVWLRRHEPDVNRRIAHVAALHDWVVYRLTGKFVTDPATSTGGIPWPADAIAFTGVPPEAFPPTYPQETIIGDLIADPAADLGLSSGIPVIVGCHDGVAANIGCGIVRPGDVCITLGSNLVVRAVTGSRLPDCFGYPIVDDGWAWVRGVHGVASQVDAIVDALDGQGLPVAPDRHMELTELADRVEPASLDLQMPTLPRGADAARAQQATTALEAGFTPAEIYRATLESAAYSVAGLIETARSDGANCDRYVITGAAAANRLLVRILSAVLKAPIEIGDQEAGLRGAAVLAAVGAGMYGDVHAAIRQMVKPGTAISASREEIEAYSRRHVDVDVGARTGAAPGDGSRQRLSF